MPINWLSRLARRLASAEAQPPNAETAVRYVMVYATIDKDAAAPLRQELLRSCGGDADLIRFAPIAGGAKVRLSLRLQADAVAAATTAIGRYGPGMEIMEVPETSSTSWLDGLLARPIAAPAAAAGIDAANPLGRILAPEDVLLDVAAADTDELFAVIGAFLEKRYGLPGVVVARQLASREDQGATAIGRGLAIPHARLKDLPQALALYLRPHAPIPFDAPDAKPVTDILVLLVPERASRLHLDLLAAAAQLFCDGAFRARLDACRDPQSVWRAFATTVTT